MEKKQLKDHYLGLLLDDVLAHKWRLLGWDNLYYEYMKKKKNA